MAVAQGPFLAAVLLLVSWLHCSSPLPACPESCTCQSTPLLNCSSAGLSFVPQQIQDSVTDLDLSHNLLDSVTLYRPHRSLRNVWLGNNSITRLSLCMERSITGRHVHRLRPQSRPGCVSWAPTLQLLSVERNQLEQLPQGLEGSESLQVLQLSFNRISTLRPGDLSHLRQLKELHLQHNLITSLHPQMFQDLAQLQVLDLSFNMLTSLHPLTYFSLRNIGADVQLGGNSWQCDCSMRSLRRRMAYDSGRGLQAWSVVCATPSIISGRDLLQVEEHDLNCFSAEDGPEVHRDVTVYSGSEILLSCSTQDSTWWTPSGQASVSQPQAGLLISDVTERDAGLYVCVSEEHEVMSVFNLQISKIGGARRKTRSLPRTSQEIIPQDTPDRIGQERNPRATQSNLALAVCLSVFITFLIAFILGVLARPCIDVLWGRITKKKSTSATHSVSSVEQRQYDNEAYCDGEEPQQIGAHRERRVTFSTVDYREDRNVQYYDTVAGDNQETINNEAVIECEVRNTNTTRDSGSENSVRLSITEDNQRDGTVLSGGHTHSIEFEHIPDPVEQEKRRSLSSCSDSSRSDKVFNEDQMTQKAATKSHQLAEDSSTDVRVEVSQISVEGTSKLPGFSSEPFADWSPHTNNTNITDPELWQENEEQFEFSDSLHSSSARSSSVRGSFNDSKLILVPISDKQRTDYSSSSSSHVSEDEPTQYTVNSDQEEEEEEDKERKHNNPEVTNASLKQGVSFEQQIHSVDSIRPTVRFNQVDYSYDKQRPVVRPEDSFSFHSSDSDVEDYTVKKGQVPSLVVTSHSKSLDTGAPSPSAAYPSSSSSESEAEIKDLKVEHSIGRLNEGIKIKKAERLSTDRDRICIPQIKRHVDIKTPLPASDSSSSDESTDETTNHTKKQEQGEVNIAGQSVTHDAMKPQCPALDPAPATTIKRRAPLPPIDSSSDESANKTMEQKQKQGEMQMIRLPIKVSQTASCDSDTQWPALDLEHIPHIKRRLDIKTPSPDSSSSSNSEDETTKHIKRQEQEQMNMARPPSKVSDTARYNPQTQWPLLDLQHTKHIKRRLDIKAPSPDSDSSSSTDSEDETTHHTEMPGKVEIAGLPLQESQTGSHDPSTLFPSIDLEHIPHIKRRLDIKAPSPPPDSSSSSDSEDETTHHTQRPGKVEITGLPFQESQTKSHNPDTKWPALDLQQTMHIKRHLDIKAPPPPPDSSSSSDSEGETVNHITKQEQVQMNMARLPSKVPDTARYNPQTQWPLLDLQHTKHIKRRLDVKVPSPDSDSSSSSDHEDETTHHIQRPGKVGITGLSFKESQTESRDPDTRWPALDLEHIPRIKRRLDIKAPSPPPDSSSSTDSEDEMTHHTEMPGKVEIAGLPLQESQTGNHDPDTRWPALDLEHIPRIKRRLDIKASSPPPDSSSSSDSENETINHMNKHKQGQMNMASPPSKVSDTGRNNPQTQWPLLDLQHTKHIKRRLDVKVPSPDSDSSSSSDSEDETTHHIQRPGKVGITGLSFKESQTESRDPDTRWPALDLEHIPHIKRRLDIKAPSPPPNSSSSTDSEDETTHHTEMPGKVEIAGLPLQESQTESHDPGLMFPSIDLERIPHIRRRLDIKAPSPPPDSSSSSDSEDETTHHIQRTGKVEITGLPFQESRTESHDPDTRWPALDLEQTMHIKRRLDIKAPPPPTNASSSSDSEEETINHINMQEQGQMNMAWIPSKVPETAHYNPQTQWPLLDLQHTKHIKRRLDIKASSPDSDSSSSSDSEDETSGHNKKQTPTGVDFAVPSFEKSQTGSHDPGTMFPSIDLEHIPRIKRRLDIKAPSPPFEPPSSCEIVEKCEQRKVHISRHPSQGSQAESRDPDTQWPVVDLEHTMRVKRRLDIKAPPPSSDSSSSSDSEDETTYQVKKGEQGETHMARSPTEISQTVRYDPQTQWPLLDLEHTKHVKRRLDVKAPSPDTDSSSSSDSEDETTHHTERPGKITFAELPLQKSQTINQDPESQWPALDLEHNLRIKRRLDIKAPSPVSDSSSSSDSEDETTLSTKTARPGVVGVVGPPFQESQTVSRDPETQWPTVDLGNITRIKRRLDIKAPSPPPDSLLSGGSTNHTMEGKREEAIKISPGHSSGSSDEQEKSIENLRYPPPTVKPDSRWPTLDLNSDLHVKRRLDIRARSPPSESSSSSDESESGTTNPPKTDVGITSHRPEGKMPDLKVNVPPVKRRLNIKAPSAQPDLVLSSVSPSSRQSESYSSRSNSEDELRDQAKAGLGVSAPLKTMEKEFITTPKTPLINNSHRPKADHNIKLEKYTVVTDDVGVKTGDNISRPPEINPELQSRWATMDLGISRFRKRLEITSQTREPPNLPSSPPPDSPSSSSSESGTGSKSSKTRQKREGVGIQGIIHTESSVTTKNKVQRKAGTELRGQTSEESPSVHPHLSLTNIPHVKRTLDIRAPLQRESSSSSSSEDETIAHSVPDLSLGVPRVKRRLDIKAPSPEPSNSSSSESENEVTQTTANQSRYPSNMSGMIDNDHLITYKRLIMKPSTPLGNSFTPSGMDQTIDHTKQRYTGTEIVTVTQGGPFHSVGDRDASLSPKRVPSMSFDDVVKKRLEQSRSTTDLDVPPEIRWTGVGRQLPDHSLPGPRRHPDVGVSSPQQPPPAKPECPPPDSSSSESDDNIKQDKGKAYVTLTHKHSSLSASGVSLASSRALDKFDSPPSSTSELLRALSEDTNKRKGLSALKAMSTERQKWDTVERNLDKGASPAFDDTSFNYRRSEEDVKPLAKQPLPQLRLSSTSVDERGAKDLLYDIPRYRRHDMGDTEPPQRAPPPVPATPPPPYEAVGLSRRFPQSSKTQGLEGTRSYLQQSRQTEESTSSSLTSQNLAVYFDSSNVNISEV
ncbi:uncharacterized protein LOC125896175 isoform X1 [Epinephelus fuscoguttatus]|uniref:uncharacterized protein LOC125896175 isoform X1 n=1 Tax=Epinephelus fuscoguttatus TaxID=293821 RepID=UPI0020D0A23B|nr:uncharacterized protein LOC125896175 isoform X1 [Epinephelus fuscoguttatus]